MAASSTSDTHPGWKLSRECIYETINAKRSGIFKQCGTMVALVTSTIQDLRETHLAPHIETKLIANRYAVRQTLKTIHNTQCDCCKEGIFDPKIYVRHADSPYVAALCEHRFSLCQVCFVSLIRNAHHSSGSNEAVVYISGGLVRWLAVPNTVVQGYLVADKDVFNCADADELQWFFEAFMAAYKPGMTRI